MSRIPRGKLFNLREPGIYHCWSRCVRRAHLCGKDSYTGKDFDHRRDWIEERVEYLAQWFAIDIVFFAIMQNHFHLVLRTWPNLVEKWTPRQVIRRSIKIYPYKFEELGVEDGEPTNEQLRKFANDHKLVRTLRARLADPSWFLRQLKQFIATRSNHEDNVTGHFFQGRFDSKAVTDEIGILICGLYVDLNQVRANEAASIKASIRTSAYRRLKALLKRRERKRGAAAIDGFLAPMHVRGDKLTKEYRPAGTLTSQRVSDRGVLEMTVDDYLQVLDWVGRQVRRDKRGAISADEPPALQAIGVEAESLVTFVEDFEELFRYAVGSPSSVADFADKLNLSAKRSRRR